MQIITSKLNIKIALSGNRNNNHGPALHFNVVLTKLTFLVSTACGRICLALHTKYEQLECAVCATCLQAKPYGRWRIEACKV